MLGDGDRVIGVLKAYYLSFWILPCLQLIISWVKNIFKISILLNFQVRILSLATEAVPTNTSILCKMRAY